MIMSRYIRFHSEKQQINLLNCGKLDEWKDTCYNRQGAFIDVCSERCKCDIYQDDRVVKWELDPNDYMCVDNDKWSVEAEYVLLKGEWVKTGNRRIKEIIERNSADCIKNFELAFEFSGDTHMAFSVDGGIVYYHADKSPFSINVKDDMGINDITSMKSMFYQPTNGSNSGVNNITRITKIPDSSNVTDMSNMFQLCENLTNVNLLSLDTSKVTSMENMFYGCLKLESLDLSNFNTNLVTNMDNMFGACIKLTTLDLSNLNTPKITNMASMFGNCYELASLNISSFDTSNVTNMINVFGGCKKIASLDLSNFNTSNVTNMNWMFSGCKNLVNLDLSNWNIKLDCKNESMFSNCPSLKTIIMKNCNQTTIDKIKATLVQSGIPDEQVTIITQ